METETDKTNNPEAETGVNSNPTETLSTVLDTTEPIIADSPLVSPVTEVPTSVVTVNEEAVVVPTTTETSSEIATVPATTTGFPLKQYVLAAGIVIVIGGLLLFGLERQGRVDTNVFGSIISMVAPEPAAAIVNGTRIDMVAYEKNKQQIIASATQQGLDFTDESILSEINTQAIDVLVNTELLRQNAIASGATVSAEQIEARYQEVLTSVGGAEALTTRMTELGLDEAALRKDIEGEILIQTYLDGAVDTSSVVIDDAKIQAVYDQAGGAEAGLPPLAEVRTEIETQVRFSEEQELVNAFIKSLRDKATIEVLI